ncbi:uncharacterized protein M6B38_307850 [Iris pallida]|uniref:Uncharacterized protein n=1 Tax=Iris pallida TaxID=29817 RepID=A0AAX6HKN6_IRIPA|nr:uncharacterized protein M6B38_307850 [Iris pallida]
MRVHPVPPRKRNGTFGYGSGGGGNQKNLRRPPHLQQGPGAPPLLRRPRLRLRVPRVAPLCRLRRRLLPLARRGPGPRGGDPPGGHEGRRPCRRRRRGGVRRGGGGDGSGPVAVPPPGRDPAEARHRGVRRRGAGGHGAERIRRRGWCHGGCGVRPDAACTVKDALSFLCIDHDQLVLDHNLLLLIPFHCLKSWISFVGVLFI